MKWKRYILRIISLILIIGTVVTVVCFSENTFFVLNDATFWRVRNFYKEDKNTLDVCIIGSSEIQCGYFPGLIYKEKGITSYPFALDSLSVQIWKSQLKEIYKRQSPQLVIIEISGVLYDKDEQLYSNTSLRRYLDNIPLSQNKLETINACKIEDEFFSYVFPIIKYHGNPSKGSFTEALYYYQSGHAKLRGIVASTSIDRKPLYGDMKSTKSAELNVNAENMLLDFLNYCKDNQYSNIVFTRFPQKATNEEDMKYLYRKNRAKDIIEEFGFSFLDCDKNAQSIGIDYEKDFYNDHHLNVFGAEKITQYLGDVFVHQFGVVPLQTNGRLKVEWDETVELTDRFISSAKQKTIEEDDDFIFESKDYITKLSMKE